MSPNSQTAVKKTTGKIIIDTGASNHFTGNPKESHNYRYYNEPRIMKNSGIMDGNIIGDGDVNNKLQTVQDQVIEAPLKNVSVAPNLEDRTFISPLKLPKDIGSSLKAKQGISKM